MKESIKKGFWIYLIFVVIAVVMYIPYGFWGLNRALAIFLWMLASIIYGIYCLYVYGVHTKNKKMIYILSISLASLLIFYGVKYYSYKTGQNVLKMELKEKQQDFSQATNLNINESVLVPAESGGREQKFIIEVPKDGNLNINLQHEHTSTSTKINIMDASNNYIYREWGFNARIDDVKIGAIYYVTVFRSASFIEYSITAEIEE